MPLTPKNPHPAARSDNASAAVPKSSLLALCAVASELTILLDRETALLRAMRVKEIEPLQADKARLTQLCGTTMKGIDPAAPIPDAVKSQWRAICKRLGDAAVANEMALRVGKAATHKLVGAIVGHIEKTHAAKTGYGRPRPIAPGTRRPPMLAGVTIDRSL
jgi:hypothetical protein